MASTSTSGGKQERWPTASKFWLARLCLHPWQGGYSWAGRSNSYASRLGSVTHKLLECTIERTVPTPTDLAVYRPTPRMLQLARACVSGGVQYLQGLGEATVRAEVAWRIAPSLGESTELFLGEARAYPPLPSLYGTADVVAVSGEALRVADWKTGMASPPYTEHARLQLRWLGVAAAKAMPVLPVEVTLDAVYLKKDGGKPWVQREVYKTAGKEWQEVEGTVQRVLEALDKPAGPVPGPHCRLCPVRGVCPEAAA